MNKKIVFGSIAGIFVMLIVVFAFTFSKGSSATQPEVKMEQVSAETNSHCDPSNCTPEQAASCPSVKATSTANAEENGGCPQTKECPATKCSPDKKSAASL